MQGRNQVDPILLRPAKAAQLADISRSVAYDLIARGVWPAVRVGRSLRVPVKDLLEWVETNKELASTTCPRKTSGLGTSTEASDAA
jgi:excisionase family DNA binding protein